MFDPEMFGAAIGKLIRESVEPLEKRIGELEGKISGIQKRVDRGMSFKGTFQPALDYEAGAVVLLNDKAFVAQKAIQAGGQLREGSGWILLIRGVS